MSIKNMTIHSFVVGSVSIFRLFSQFFVLPFLARYLSPEDYGVIALAMPFILFSIMFARSGIEAPLLREDTRDEKIWSASFWFVTASGIFFTAVMIGLAPLTAWFFETPQLGPILSWMAIGILFQAMSIVPLAALRYDHRFKVVSIVQIISMVLGMITAVIIAMKGGGAWALAWQGLVMQGSLFLMAFAFCRFRPKFFFNLKMIKEHILFGYSVMGANFLEFSRDTLRSFILGKVLGAALLGFYSLAYLFLYLPYRVINTVMPDVIYRYLVPFKDDMAVLRSMLLLITRCLASLVLPFMIMIAVANKPVFGFILSDKWIFSGHLYMLVAPAAALAAVISVRIIFMQIIGKVGVNMRCNLEYLIVQTGFLLVFVWFGMEWAMIGFALSMLVYLPRELWILKTHFACGIKDYINVFIPAVIATLVGALTYLGIVIGLGVDKPLIQLILAALCGLLCLGCAFALQYKTVKHQITQINAVLKTH